MQETLEIKLETKKLREERERMSEELLQKKRELDLLRTRSIWVDKLIEKTSLPAWKMGRRYDRE